MGGIFDLDGPLMRALNGFADIIVMSLWWVIGCLPIVTIGASTTALYYAAMKSTRKDGTVTKNFWKSFRENWKQATITELILVVLAVGLYVLYGVAYGMAGGISIVVKIVFHVLFFLFLVLASFVFPILSRFVTTVPMLFHNAVILCLGHFPRAVFIVLLHLLPLLLIFLRIDWFVMALPLLVALIPGTIASWNAPSFLKMFERYTPQEILEEEEEATQNLGMFDTEE